MLAVRRLLVLPILVGAIVAFSALATAPEPAQAANNCQVEQLPGLPPLMPEEEDPRCIVLKALGCPNLQDGTCVRGVLARADEITYCIRAYHPFLNPSLSCGN